VADRFHSTILARSHKLGHERLHRFVKGQEPVLNLSTLEMATLEEWNAWDIRLYGTVKASMKTRQQRVSSNDEPPPLDHCARDLGVKWAEPLERLRGRLSCRRRPGSSRVRMPA